jgi:hypothetical protein
MLKAIPGLNALAYLTKKKSLIRLMLGRCCNLANVYSNIMVIGGFVDGSAIDGGDQQVVDSVVIHPGVNLKNIIRLFTLAKRIGI